MFEQIHTINYMKQNVYNYFNRHKMQETDYVSGQVNCDLYWRYGHNYFMPEEELMSVAVDMHRFIKGKAMSRLLEHNNKMSNIPDSVLKWESLLQSMCYFWWELNRIETRNLRLLKKDHCEHYTEFIVKEGLPAMMMVLRGTFLMREGMQGIETHILYRNPYTLQTHQLPLTDKQQLSQEKEKKAASRRVRKQLMTDDDEALTLHAACRVPCPLTLMERILDDLELEDEDEDEEDEDDNEGKGSEATEDNDRSGAKERNEQRKKALRSTYKGMTPLSMACSLQRMELLEPSFGVTPTEHKDIEDGKPRPIRDQHKDNFIRLLCLRHPWMALVPDATSVGLYPLHQACLSGYTWEEGLREIFQAAPKVIGLSDEQNGLYLPFVCFAMTYAETRCGISKAFAQEIRTASEKTETTHKGRPAEKVERGTIDPKFWSAIPKNSKADSASSTTTAETDEPNLSPSGKKKKNSRTEERGLAHILIPTSDRGEARREPSIETKKNRRDIDAVNTLYILLQENPATVANFQ